MAIGRPAPKRSGPTAVRPVHAHYPTNVPVEVYEELLDVQHGKCAITGQTISPARPGICIRVDPALPPLEDNLVVIQRWLVDTPDPVCYDVLVEQWRHRNRGRTQPKQDLPF